VNMNTSAIAWQMRERLALIEDEARALRVAIAALDRLLAPAPIRKRTGVLTEAVREALVASPGCTIAELHEAMLRVRPHSTSACRRTTVYNLKRSGRLTRNKGRYYLSDHAGLVVNESGS
jgi:hypothetical protein